MLGAWQPWTDTADCAHPVSVSMQCTKQLALTMKGRTWHDHLKCRIKAASTPDMVAMCSKEQASSLCSRDLGECSGGVPGGVGVAVALSLPAAGQHQN